MTESIPSPLTQPQPSSQYISKTHQLINQCSKQIQSADNDLLYHKYIYINDDSISSHLKCTICTNVFINPVVHTTCLNTFCSSCVDEWCSKGNTTCVLCRSDITQPSNTRSAAPLCINGMIDDLLIQCIKCDTQMKQSMYTSHQCMIQQLCPNLCATLVHNNHMSEHIMNHCTNSTIQCPANVLQCTWSGYRAELQSHIQSCTYYTTYHKLSGLQCELDNTLVERNKYINLYSSIELDNNNLRNKLIHTQMDSLVERTVFSVYGTSFANTGTTQQTRDLLQCAFELVDTLYIFTQHVLLQDNCIQPITIKYYIQPAIRDLNTNLYAIKQRYINKSISPDNTPVTNNTNTRTRASTTLSPSTMPPVAVQRTRRVFDATEHNRNYISGGERCNIM